MARFDVGDRVRVVHEQLGQPAELLDATGTILVVGLIIEVVGRNVYGRETKEHVQLYGVEFDTLGVKGGVHENWLRPA